MNADVVTRTRRVWAMLIGGDEIKLAGGVLGAVDVLTGARLQGALWCAGRGSVGMTNAHLRVGSMLLCRPVAQCMWL